MEWCSSVDMKVKAENKSRQMLSNIYHDLRQASAQPILTNIDAAID
jgi:hypothetical protein